MSIGVMVVFATLGVVTSSPLAQSSVHVKFVSPPHAYSHGVEVSESIPGVTISPRRFLDVSPSPRRIIDVSPSSRRIINVTPSPRRIIDPSPSHRRFIDVTPSPRRIIDSSPSHRRYVTSSPRRTMNASPSSRRRFIHDISSPQRIIDTSPSPRRIISVSPSSRIISISPDPSGIITVSPGPRRIIEADGSSRRVQSSLPRASSPNRNRGSRRFVFPNEDLDTNSVLSNPEAMWPAGVFLPPDNHLTNLGFELTDDSLYDGLSEDSEDDPLLLTGTEAMETVKYLFSLGELFFGSIPHDRALMANQVHRQENGLDGNRLGSNRPESPFYRWSKRRSSF